MKHHCRRVSSALVCELTMLVNDCPRCGGIATECVLASMLAEGLIVVHVEDVHNERVRSRASWQSSVSWVILQKS